MSILRQSIGIAIYITEYISTCVGAAANIVVAMDATSLRNLGTAVDQAMAQVNNTYQPVIQVAEGGFSSLILMCCAGSKLICRKTTQRG